MTRFDLRTATTYEKYLRHIDTGGLVRHGCPLCQKPSLHEFEHWRIVQNDFPYDRIAKTHHMLIPKEHSIEIDLSQEVLTEYLKIKQEYLPQHYEIVMQSLAHKQSIPAHHHYHLVVIKETE